MKPVGLFGTDVAQTEALVVWCIEDAIWRVTICRLQGRERDSGRGEAARNLGGLGSSNSYLLSGRWGVCVCDARLMYEERLKPEATGKEPSLLAGRS